VRVVFLGSGVFAIPSFEGLIEAGHEVQALVTQPDREKGRGRATAPPPLKPVAEARGVPVLQPRRIRDAEALVALRGISPEIQIVVAYGQILPRPVIDLPSRGTINVHASLLPRYRGAAPVQWAIVRGESETGVTTMRIDEGLDTGPTLLSRATAIGPEETAPELEGRLARLGALVLLDTLRGIEAGTAREVPQDHGRATLAPPLRKEDGRIDWARPAGEIARRVRGFLPWPGSSTSIEGKALRILKAFEAPPGPGEPGVVQATAADGVVVACGEATRLRIVEVHPDSRRPMTASAFAAGARLGRGARFA
jgi:methionyl-tRNA formyltransferase